MKLGLFASVHSADVLSQCNWTEEMIVELFDNFNPDVICGEVRKEDFDTNASYQGPGEYRRYIFDYCKTRDIPFIPCDWFCEETIAASKTDEMDTANAETLCQYNILMEDYMSVGMASDIPFNSDEYNSIVEKKQLLQQKSNPYIHKLIWTDRNNHILENIKNVVKLNEYHKILVVFGAEHIYWLKKHLENKPDIEIIFPLNSKNQNNG